jgi:hypothetical protein
MKRRQKRIRIIPTKTRF